MPTIPDRIYLGDSYSIKYQSYEPNQESTISYGFSKVALDPESAYVQLYNVQIGEYVEFSLDTITAPAAVDDNEISYTFAADLFADAGDYRVFVTAVYDDDRTVTESRRVKVLQRQ